MDESDSARAPERAVAVSGPTSGATSGPTTGIASGSKRDWRKVRDVGVATLAWLTVIGVVFWGLAHIIGTLLMFILAAILAYALSPAVKHLERFMPRGAAIALVYIGILTTLSGLIYLIAITAVGQVSMLLGDLQSLLSPSSGQSSPLVAGFRAVGLSDAQIQGAANKMLAQVQNLTGDAVTVAASVIDAVVRTVLVGVVSIYLLKDGPLAVQWLRNNTPISHRPRVVFAVETLDTVVGGYIRGQLTLSALIGLLVGGGMWAFHVPYAVFLGVLAFVLEFVPLVGVFVSGAICVILALTVGWLTAVFVLAYFVIVHFIEGDFVGPRIMSKAVGLHPAVSILALFAGAEVFGIWGALFAAPAAGLVQAVLRALWLEWRASHPEQFPTGYTVTPTVRVVPVTHPDTPLPGGVEPRAAAAGPGRRALSGDRTAVTPEQPTGVTAADGAREHAKPGDGGLSLRALPPFLSLVAPRPPRPSPHAQTPRTADPPSAAGSPEASSSRYAIPAINRPLREAHSAQPPGAQPPGAQPPGAQPPGAQPPGAQPCVEPPCDRPLLPEVDAWTHRPTEHSIYDQFVSSVGEDVIALKDDVNRIEAALEEDVAALEDDVSRLHGPEQDTDGRPRLAVDPPTLGEPAPDQEVHSC